jgi:hypothetical protein
MSGGQKAQLQSASRAVLEGDEARDFGGGCRGLKLEACCCDVRVRFDLGKVEDKLEVTAESKSDSKRQVSVRTITHP